MAPNQWLAAVNIFKFSKNKPVKGRYFDSVAAIPSCILKPKRDSHILGGDSFKGYQVNGMDFAALVLGVVVGFACHQTAADAKAAEDVAGYFSMAADIFLRMIKMIIGLLNCI